MYESITMIMTALAAGGVLGGVFVIIGVVLLVSAINSYIEAICLMVEYENGDPAAGEKLKRSMWFNIFGALISYGSGKLLGYTINRLSKSRLLKEFGEEFIENVARNMDEATDSFGDIEKAVKRIQQTNVSDDIIKEYAEKLGKNGIDWLDAKRVALFTESEYRKLLTLGDNLVNYSDDFLASFKKLKGYQDDIINIVKTYGDDAAEAIGKYSSDAVVLIGVHGKDAAEAMVKKGIAPDVIYKLDDFGIKPSDYTLYGINSDFAAALRNSNGYQDDIINIVKTYGQDGTKAIIMHGDNAAVLIGTYGDDAIEALVRNNIGTDVIYELDRLGIKLTDYKRLGIVSQEIAEGVVESAENFITNLRVRNITSKAADEVNEWWKVTRGYTNPPYTPSSIVLEVELEESTQFVRVYDEVNSPMKGQWFMKAEDIAGLTPKQIQEKFSLLTEPKYVVDLQLPAGSRIRTGEANSLFGFTGKGIQFDMMGQYIGDWINPRQLP